MAEFLKDTFTPYAITALLGAAAAVVVIFIFGKKRRMPTDQLIYMCIYAAIGVFIGGHLMFFLVGLPDFIRDFSDNVHSFGDLWVQLGYAASGLVFYGGLLGALLMLLIFCRRYKLPLKSELNNFVVAFPLFHFFGRIGCHLTGCCYGIEYHGIGCIHYDPSQINPGVNDDLADFSRFPVQLMEAGIELIIFIVLLIIYIKNKDKYSLTCIYLISYSIVRFSDEFLRGDAIRGFWGPFSTSQWISLAILTSVIIYLIVRKRRRATAQ